MTAYRGEIWLANLNPSKRANEIGKIRPVLIFQNDELNKSDYPTTVIIPFAASLIDDAEPLRYRINKRGKLEKESDLLMTQIRSIDKERLIQKIATLSKDEMAHAKELLDELLLPSL